MHRGAYLDAIILASSSDRVELFFIGTDITLLFNLTENYFFLKKEVDCDN